MIDFLFIEFYIRKKYNQNMQTYFGVNDQAVSKWRKALPQKRIHEFVFKESSSDIVELIKKIY